MRGKGEGGGGQRTQTHLELQEIKMTIEMKIRRRAICSYIFGSS